MPRKPTSASSQPDQERRWPLLLKYVLIGLVPLALLCAFFSDHDGFWEVVGYGVVAGIAASALWWGLFANFAETEVRNLLDRQLDAQRIVMQRETEKLRKILSDEIAFESRRWRELRLPRTVYAAAEGFDLRFNRDLTEDLRRSRIYYFSGPSGVYVPARIRLRPNETRVRLEDVFVKMIDPRSALAMDKAIADRQRRRAHLGKSQDEIRAEIRTDLVLTHVALWDAREFVYGPIRISYEDDAITRRLEVFEEGAYDSSIDREDKESFPPTAAWDRYQTTWEQARAEFSTNAFTGFTITSNVSEEQLREQLEELELDPGDLDAHRRRYAQDYLLWLERGLKEVETYQDEIKSLRVTPRSDDE